MDKVWTLFKRRPHPILVRRSYSGCFDSAAIRRLFGIGYPIEAYIDLLADDELFERIFTSIEGRLGFLIEFMHYKPEILRLVTSKEKMADFYREQNIKRNFFSDYDNISMLLYTYTIGVHVKNPHLKRKQKKLKNFIYKE